MADVLGIKVRLELDTVESGSDLAKQINKINLPPVTVKLKIGEILNKE